MKTALITGVGRGIGKALAEKFLAEDYEVIGTSQTGRVPYSNDNLTIYKLDLTSEELIAEVAKKIRESGKKIDILINNAGVLLDDEETKILIDKLRGTLEVNLIGTINFTEHIIPFINKNGHIINTTSSAGSLAIADKKNNAHWPCIYPAYKISKTALNMYTRTLAMRLEYEKTGIVVSSIHPGWVKTAMGGSTATTTPEEAAKWIFNFAITHPETGQFWFNGEKYPW